MRTAKQYVEDFKTHHVVYHRADHDGVFAGAVIERALKCRRGLEVTMHPWDFGDEPISIPYDEGAVVWVTDLPYSGKVLKRTAQNIVWIDHHVGNFDEVRDWCGYTPDGLFDVTTAACWNCWTYLGAYLPPGSAPKVLKAIERWDRFDLDDEVKAVHHDLSMGVPLSDTTRALHKAQRVLEWSAEGYGNCVRRGERLVEYWRQRMTDYAAGAVSKLTIDNLQFKCLNTPIRSSTAFGDDEGGLMLVWAVLEDGETVRVSMYASPSYEGDVDLSIIAKRYGGGGHKRACGFQMELWQFYYMLQWWKQANDHPEAEYTLFEHLEGVTSILRSGTKPQIFESIQKCYELEEATRIMRNLDNAGCCMISSGGDSADFHSIFLSKHE